MFLKAFLVVFGCLFIGELIVHGLDLPLPAGVVGFALLFLALQLKLIKLQTVERLAKVLLDYLAILVVPACISVMQYLHVIRGELWILVMASTISTLAVLITTAKSYEWLRRLQKYRWQKSRPHSSKQKALSNDKYIK